MGVELDPAHIEVAEMDRFGNHLHARRIVVPIQGRRAEQVEPVLAEAVAGIGAQAKAAGKPVVIERLDFREKKARLHPTSRWCRTLPTAFDRSDATLVRNPSPQERPVP